MKYNITITKSGYNPMDNIDTYEVVYTQRFDDDDAVRRVANAVNNKESKSVAEMLGSFTFDEETKQKLINRLAGSVNENT